MLSEDGPYHTVPPRPHCLLAAAHQQIQVPLRRYDDFTLFVFLDHTVCAVLIPDLLPNINT